MPEQSFGGANYKTVNYFEHVHALFMSGISTFIHHRCRLPTLRWIGRHSSWHIHHRQLNVYLCIFESISHRSPGITGLAGSLVSSTHRKSVRVTPSD
jgi:hypothetical protein